MTSFVIRNHTGVDPVVSLAEMVLRKKVELEDAVAAAQRQVAKAAEHLINANAALAQAEYDLRAFNSGES